MSRRKKSEHANHERWLVSYADFITLLFAFFVVLYASSEVDKRRAARVSAAIHGAFEELGVFTGSGADSRPAIPKEITVKLPERENLAAMQSQGSSGGFGGDTNRLKHDLEQALGEQIKKREIDIRVTPEGLVVSLREVGFFNSGEATLLTDGQSTLARIAKVLYEKGFQIRVEGHTDNVPIRTSQFKSNWDLSTARATEVVALLVEQHGFDPRQMSAAGYGEYRPLDSNHTEEGRRSNRRVDLVVVAQAPSHEQPPSNQ
jgi:chemotaxis protein MotB